MLNCTRVFPSDNTVDDFAYVEQLGPVLSVRSLGFDEDAERPGERGTLRATIDMTQAYGGLPTRNFREGQFEHYERARNRLLFVVPVALCLIFVLLYFTYGRVPDALRVFTGVPFAAVGGVLALWLRDLPFSISAGVGFVALSGVSVLGDMVLVSRVRQLLAAGLPLGDAIREAAVTRLRPVLMTGLRPMRSEIRAAGTTATSQPVIRRIGPGPTRSASRPQKRSVRMAAPVSIATTGEASEASEAICAGSSSTSRNQAM